MLRELIRISIYVNVSSLKALRYVLASRRKVSVEQKNNQFCNVKMGITWNENESKTLKTHIRTMNRKKQITAIIKIEKQF